MTLKGDAKFEGKLTRALKNYLRNLVDFHASSRKSGNLHFHGLLSPKPFKYLDEKVQKSYVSWHWRVIQSLTLGSKNGIRNLLNFNESSGKSEQLHFDVLLLPIAYKVSAKTLHTEKRSKLWRKTDYLFEKWH